LGAGLKVAGVPWRLLDWRPDAPSFLYGLSVGDGALLSRGNDCRF
jgi:hypothetical protein